MKKFLTSITFLLVSIISFAQTKNDVILKLDGDELVGKVLKINDNDVEFAYAGETLVYNIKKAEIMKITFGSGRIQVFNKPQQAAPAQNSAPASADKSNLEDHHNKVAILPFGFIRDGQPADGEQIQNECYSFMNKHSGVYTILPPRTTNAQLIKAGINSETIKGFTMEDICNVLGVEYVVDGLVTMNKTTQTTTQSNSGAVKSKDDDDRKDRKYNSYSYGTATQNFQTKLSLAIYNDKGTAVYSQDRTAFWNTQDAYSNTLEYLLKRSPLYTK